MTSHMRDGRLLKILVQQRALVKLLRTIGQPTRQIIDQVGSIRIWTQTSSKSTKDGIGTKKNCKK
jgi:hypothetical protein